MKKLIVVSLLLLSTLTSWGQEVEKLPLVQGVEIGKVKYVQAATVRDEALERAIVKAFNVAPKTEVRYLYNRVSLSKGGRQALVLLPGQEFSGSGGSSAAVFEQSGGSSEYRLVTRLTSTRNPFLVIPGVSKGWHDLVLGASGGGMQAQFSRLRFDGKTYPTNPTIVSKIPSGTVLNGTAYLANPLSPTVGLSFVAP